MRHDAIVSLLESIRTHMGTHLYHHLMRRVLEGLQIEPDHWRSIHAILGGELAEEVEHGSAKPAQLQGAVAALLAFTRAIRSQVCNHIGDLLRQILRTRPQDRMLRDATLVNFDANVQRLNDLTRQLIREIEDQYPELRETMAYPEPGELDFGCSARS